MLERHQVCQAFCSLSLQERRRKCYFCNGIDLMGSALHLSLGGIISSTKVIYKELDKPTTIGRVLLSLPQARLIVSLRGIEWI